MLVNWLIFDAWKKLVGLQMSLKIKQLNPLKRKNMQIAITSLLDLLGDRLAGLLNITDSADFSNSLQHLFARQKNADNFSAANHLYFKY